jgi:hypothetical protein
VEEGVTSDDKYETLRHMLALQHGLRTVAEAAEMQGKLAQETGADGLAFAVYMLRESILIYSKELSRWVTEYIGESDE